MWYYLLKLAAWFFTQDDWLSQVMFHNGNTNNEADMEVCLRVEGVTLPSSGHFGLSAATGGLAGIHSYKLIQAQILCFN